jgi:hypothetical protein
MTKINNDVTFDKSIAQTVLERMGCIGVIDTLRKREEVTTLDQVLVCFASNDVAQKFVDLYTKELAQH